MDEGIPIATVRWSSIELDKSVPLGDVIAPNPRILFVGINPSLRSAAVGHHFAGPGNPFWRLLYGSRLVPGRSVRRGPDGSASSEWR